MDPRCEPRRTGHQDGRLNRVFTPGNPTVWVVGRLLPPDGARDNDPSGHELGAWQKYGVKAAGHRGHGTSKKNVSCHCCRKVANTQVEKTGRPLIHHQRSCPCACLAAIPSPHIWLYIRQATFLELHSSDSPTLVLELGPTQAYASTNHSYQTSLSFVCRHMLISSSVSVGK